MLTNVIITFFLSTFDKKEETRIGTNEENAMDIIT